MQNKIAIITSGHPPFDERIFWKFGLSLVKNNYLVRIICSTKDIDTEKDGIHFTGFDGIKMTRLEKTNKLFEILNSFSPDMIICCESLTVIPAIRFKLLRKRNIKIIYDVTEWYPEGIVSKIKGGRKYLAYIFLYALNLILCNLTNAIVIGETAKLRRYRLIAPLKKKLIIGYYPVLDFFNYTPPLYDGKTLVLCYAGLINFKRGIKKLLQISFLLAERHTNIKVKLKLVGKFESVEEEELFHSISSTYNNILIEKAGWTDYNNISRLLSDVDICFDLREMSFIYKNSLPIKIFEYMACGKPFIFSDVTPIRRELGKINCGFLVDPNDSEDITKKVELYLEDRDLLTEHSKNGRQIIENGKNWETESVKLLKLVSSLLR